MERVTGHVFFPATARGDKLYKARGKADGLARHRQCSSTSVEGAMRCAVMDIARVHVLEAELRQYHCLLEKMVGQRCAQLNRRIAILKSCNAKLSAELDRAHRMHAGLLSQRAGAEPPGDCQSAGGWMLAS